MVGRIGECASGAFLDMARKKGWETTGVEVSRASSEYARESFGLNVTTGILEDAALLDDCFDVVTMWDVVEHLPCPSETIAECLRIIKPGGLLLVHTPNHDSLIYKAALCLCRLLHGKRLANFLGPLYGGDGHLYYFNRKSLKRLLQDFEICYAANEPVWMEPYVLRKSPLTAIAAVLVDSFERIMNRRYRMTLIARKVSSSGINGEVCS